MSKITNDGLTQDAL